MRAACHGWTLRPVSGRRSRTGRSVPDGIWIASLTLTFGGWRSPCGRLHTKKHLNEAVDKVRKAQGRQLSGIGFDTLKKAKYR